jgi:hypothetical protein
MDNSLIDLLLVLWFFLTGLYLCFWIVGSKIRDKLPVQNDEQTGLFLIRVAMVYLVFIMGAILFLAVTGQTTLQFIIGALFSLTALLISLGLFFMSRSMASKKEKLDK